MKVEQWGSYVVKEKLKLLKSDLKGWNKNIFGHIEANIGKEASKIKLWDEKVELGGFRKQRCIEKQLIFIGGSQK